MSYTIERGQVFFYDSRLKAADVETFEILSEDFARDKNAVYVNRKRFAGGDPASLVVLPKREGHPTQYAHDARHVYKTNLPAIVKGLDGASFRAHDAHYGADRLCVYSFDGERILKRADPGTFEVLGSGYAKDRDSVFFEGERVSGADTGSFHVLGPRMARNDKGVFCVALKMRGIDPATFHNLAGNYYLSGAHDVFHYDKPVRSARAESFAVIASDYAKDDRAVYYCSSPLEGAEPETFQLLDVGYAKDRRRVFFTHAVVKEADAQTFVVAAGLASDRYKTYHGVRGTEKSPDFERPVDASEIEGFARTLFAQWIAAIFPVLDSVKSNDWNLELDSIEPAPGAVQSLPDYRLEVDGCRLRVRCGDFSVEGSFAGYLTLIGALWGIARKKVLGATPCVRMFDERGVSGPEGDIVIEHVTKKTLEPTFHVFDLLSRAKLTEEATLILYHIMKVVEYDNSPEGVAIQQKLRQRVPESTLADLSYYTLKGVTSGRASPQSFIKRLIQSPYLSSHNTLDRVRAAEFFHQNLGEMSYSNLLNFNKLVPPFLRLLQDPHPLVRDLMWQNLDFLVSKLFYEHAYRACLEYLPRLIERGINLDINLARRWECYLAFGEDEKAASHWEALETITSRYERALEKRDYRLERVDLLRTGLYRKDAQGFFHFVQSTADVSAAIGEAYGIEYRLEGDPLSRTVPTTVKVFHQPDETAKEKGHLLARYEPVSYVGMNNAFYWAFEKADEIKPGRLAIELSIDAGGERPLLLEQAFLLHEP